MPSAPPPSSPVDDINNSDVEAHLDAEILQIHREIAKLRSQKKQLSSALLGSFRVQKHVHDRKTLRNGSDKLQERLEEAVERQRRENDVSIHRLALGVTAFPFSDPAPERQGEPAMLGVRFDLAPAAFDSISARRTTAGCGADALQTDVGGRETSAQQQQQQHSAQEGQLENTYFVMLRRLRYQGRTYLRVHHHTIPGHIDVEHYADQYLPLPEAFQHNEDAGINEDGADGNSTREESAPFEDDSGIDVTQDIQLDPNTDPTSDPTNLTDLQQGTETGANPPSRPSTSTTANIQTTNQDLHAFTNRLRADLQSWHNRRKSISHIRHSLGLHDHQTSSNRGATPTTPPPTFDQYQYQYQSTASTSTPTPNHAISSLTQTTNDARQLKIVWQDETLGLLRLSHDGSINRAIVYGTKSKSKSGSSRTSQSHSEPESESESELSELESDDDRNIIRIRAQKQKQKDAKKEADEQRVDHVRMHEVERLLMVNEGGGRVMVQDLVGRLRVIGERGFSA